MTPEMMWEYWAERTRYQDSFDRGRNEGFDTGRREGFDSGMREGFDKGRNEGFDTGRRNNQRETARRMRMAGFPDEQICELTGLPPEELSTI